MSLLSCFSPLPRNERRGRSFLNSSSIEPSSRTMDPSGVRHFSLLLLLPWRRADSVLRGRSKPTLLVSPERLVISSSTRRTTSSSPTPRSSSSPTDPTSRPSRSASRTSPSLKREASDFREACSGGLLGWSSEARLSRSASSERRRAELGMRRDPTCSSRTSTLRRRARRVREARSFSSRGLDDGTSFSSVCSLLLRPSGRRSERGRSTRRVIFFCLSSFVAYVCLFLFSPLCSAPDPSIYARLSSCGGIATPSSSSRPYRGLVVTRLSALLLLPTTARHDVQHASSTLTPVSTYSHVRSDPQQQRPTTTSVPYTLDLVLPHPRRLGAVDEPYIASFLPL